MTGLVARIWGNLMLTPEERAAAEAAARRAAIQEREAQILSTQVSGIITRNNLGPKLHRALTGGQ